MLAERASPSLADLRALLRRQAPRTLPGSERVAPTGVAAVDALLGGGLPRGKLTELCGARSAGRTAMSLALLAAATGQRGEVAALVDVAGALDARRAEAAGVELPRLLWVRPGEARAGLQAAGIVLDAGGFGLVILDVGESLPRLPEAGFLRLARAAEKASAVVVLVAPRPMAGTFSALRLQAGGRRGPRFLDDKAGALRASPRVLLGVDSQLVVERSRAGAEGAAAPLHLSLRG